MLKFYNTKTRHLETFQSLQQGKVSLYTCGPTVYNEPHIGNWVAFLRWDVLVRTLEANNYIVNRVINITDVGHLVSDGDEGEDKMQKGARREGVSAWDIAERYTKSFMNGMHQLNLVMPTHIAKATDYIDQQIQLVKTLESKGYTYTISDGVYFDTAQFSRYADFAKLNLDNIKAGARVTHNDEKRQPSDFALWKFSPTHEQRDMEWQSPWGKGFPGWHLECSAISQTLLGETIDIHTGGIDHIPVHHTNEIAQSECANDTPLANYWLHANFLMVDGTKISKSLNNGFVLKDLEQRGFSPMDFKLFILQSHYRSETNFTWDNLQAAKNRLNHWYSIAEIRHQITDTNEPTPARIKPHQSIDNIIHSLNNDLDTPGALATIDEVCTTIDQATASDIDKESLLQFLRAVDQLLGLDLTNTTPDISDEQKRRIAERLRAREAKNWNTSDEIRDELLREGIHLKDSSNRTYWTRH